MIFIKFFDGFFMDDYCFQISRTSDRQENGKKMSNFIPSFYRWSSSSIIFAAHDHVIFAGHKYISYFLFIDICSHLNKLILSSLLQKKIFNHRHF